jgi:hypothetical protein
MYVCIEIVVLWNRQQAREGFRRPGYIEELLIGHWTFGLGVYIHVIFYKRALLTLEVRGGRFVTTHHAMIEDYYTAVCVNFNHPAQMSDRVA